MPIMSAAKSIMAFVALSLLSAAANAAVDEPQGHEGVVVSAAGDKLVMSDTAGKQHTHTVDPAAKITVHGKPGKLEDLKAGDAIRVMVDAKGKVLSVATVDERKTDPKG
jgi:hypothetical protein